MKPLAKLTALLGLLLLLAGCETTTFYIEVDSETDTNQGRPVYVVVRRVDETAFLTETYEEVASSVFKTPQDPTLVLKEALIPGESWETEMEIPTDPRIAIYFMFTEPGDRWKTLLKQPYPDGVSFELSKNQISYQD